MTYPETLQFRPYDLRELGSVGALFAGRSPRARRGIYILHFENGERYVGKTVDIVGRIASHRRHWPDIRAFEFASCAKRDLSTYEADTVRAIEATHAVRNIALTGRPGGESIEIVHLADGKSIKLPWDRSARTLISVERRDAVVRRKSAQFDQLRARDDYPALRKLIGRFIYETIADPEQTTGRLWFLSAMPNTAPRPYRRLFTLSCGGLEALRAVVDSRRPGVVEVYLNVAPRDAAGRPFLFDGRDPGLFTEEVAYRHARAVVIGADGVDAAMRALDRDSVLEAAYQLNTELMRKGSRVLSRFHNPAFAGDALRAAAEGATDRCVSAGHITI